MKKSATWGFTKTGKPGLTWPTGSYAPILYQLATSSKCLFSRSFTVAHDVETILIVSQSARRKSLESSQHPAQLSPRTTTRLVCVLHRRTLVEHKKNPYNSLCTEANDQGLKILKSTPLGFGNQRFKSYKP